MRRRALLFTSLAVVALLAGGVQWWNWKTRRAQEEYAERHDPSGKARPPSLQPATYLLGHADGVHAAEFSSDGAFLITASHDGSARLWDARGGKEIRDFVAHGGAVFDAAFSADGKRVVTAGDDGKVMVWDAANGDLLSILPGHPGPVFAAAILPDGSVVSAGGDGLLRRWNVEDESEVGQLHGHGAGIYAMDVTRDGKRAATGSADGMLVFWDLEAGRSLWQSPWPSGSGGPPAVRSVVVSSDGATVFAAAYGRNPEVFDAKTGRHSRSFREAGNSATLALSGDGRRLLVASEDGTSVWDTDGMRPTHILSAPEKRVVHAVALSPDVRWAVVGRGGYNSPGIGWVRADDPRVPMWDLGAKK